ncbi:MAG TPA: ABC transporter ATP-binding protein, partial [Micavibrio sp.]
MKASPDPIILPDEAAMPVDSSGFFAWLWFFLKPYGHTFAGFFSLRVARYTILSLVPLVIGYIINAFEDGWAFDRPGLLLALIAGYLAVYAAANLSIVLFVNEARMEDRIIRGMTLFSVRHMNRLPLSWHESQGSGGKLQRVMTARGSLKQLYMVYKWSLIPFIAGVLAIFVSILMMKAPFFFIPMYAGFIITFFIAGFYSARKIPELHNRHNILNEKLMAGVYEFVSAVRTVKAFHMGEYIEREARRRETDGHGAMSHVFRATYMKWAVLNSVGFFWITAFILTGIAGIYQRWLSAGTFATLFFLTYNLWVRLEEIVYMQDQFLESRNGFMRLTETLKTPPVAYDHAPLRGLPRDWSEIAFRHVDFAYIPGDGKSPPALHDIDFSIRRGEKIALVGRSGAGKSTFVKLLMKQAEPVAGTIAVDDVELKHIPSSEWLGLIGFVPQDVELFNMSIRDNILLDRDYNDRRETYDSAMKHAALDQLIASLPQGDQTMVGERGIKLSGGQRQRLGIARALVRDAELIIFDEATASLDSLSEQIIQNALADAFAGRTMVMIAHRLSTVRFADRIVVLENGQIVEQGSFNDLIKANGKFATMWELQSAGFIDGSSDQEHVD